MRLFTRFASTAVLMAMITFVACKKDSPAPSGNNNNNSTACNGKMMCFKLDGTLEEYDYVAWKKIAANGSTPERYRILWETNSGGYSNIEIDVYATTTGTFNIKSGAPYAANDAAFQYYVKGGTRNIQGKSGTVTITTIDNTNKTITGTFTVTADDKGTEVKITEGNFVNVPFK